MSEQQNPEMLAALQALLAKAQQPTNGWTQPQPAALPITGISIPMKIDTPIGSVRVDLHLPAECGQSHEALMRAIQTMVQAGYPVDGWQKRENWDDQRTAGGGGWGHRGGGSWGNRGGYGRKY